MAQTPESDNIIRPSQFVLPPGGSDPSDPTVETRLAHLEAAVEAIRLDLAEIKGKLSNVPTTFQLVFILAGFVVAIFAAAFGLLKLTALH
jgi:hypothetical protein